MDAAKNWFTLRNVAIFASIFTGLVLIVAISGALTPKPAVITPAPVQTQTATPTPEPSVEPEVAPEDSALYSDCAAVWVALERPITQADEGYPATQPNKFDIDSDGVGCEDNPTTPEDESEIDWKAVWDKTKGNAEEFGDWAGPKLKNFWDDFGAPTLDGVWDETKSIFGINL